MLRNSRPLWRPLSPRTTFRTRCHLECSDCDRCYAMFDEADQQRTVRIAEAVQRYADTPKGQGLRHHAYFRLARQLIALSRDDAAVKQYLLAADDDGSRPKGRELDRMVRNAKRYP